MTTVRYSEVMELGGSASPCAMVEVCNIGQPDQAVLGALSKGLADAIQSVLGYELASSLSCL